LTYLEVEAQEEAAGLVAVKLDVASDVIGKLIRLGWLPTTRRGDKDAITTALIELAEIAIVLELKPGQAGRDASRIGVGTHAERAREGLFTY